MNVPHGPVRSRMAVMAILVATGLLLGGCDSAEEAVSETTPSKSASKPAAPRGDDMVSAVAATREGGLVTMHFELTRRPMPGEPVEIKVAITPTGPLDRMNGRFQATPGLELIEGAELAPIDNPPADKPVEHRLVLKPTTDGLYAVSAVIVADAPTGSAARTFSIPVIAGNGLAPIAEAPPVANAQEPAATP